MAGKSIKRAPRDKLVTELRSLRGRQGLTNTGVSKCKTLLKLPVVLKTAERDGLTPAAAAYEVLLAGISSLPEGRDSRALRAAYGLVLDTEEDRLIPQGERPHTVAKRRADLIEAQGWASPIYEGEWVTPDTVENWENVAIDELAELLLSGSGQKGETAEGLAPLPWLGDPEWSWKDVYREHFVLRNTLSRLIYILGHAISEHARAKAEGPPENEKTRRLGEEALYVSLHDFVKFNLRAADLEKKRSRYSLWREFPISLPPLSPATDFPFTNVDLSYLRLVKVSTAQEEHAEFLERLKQEPEGPALVGLWQKWIDSCPGSILKCDTECEPHRFLGRLVTFEHELVETCHKMAKRGNIDLDPRDLLHWLDSGELTTYEVRYDLSE